MSDHTHLFTVRIWYEQTDDERSEVRGRVKHITSGEWRHFRSWNDLRTFLDTHSDKPQTKSLL